MPASRYWLDATPVWRRGSTTITPGAQPDPPPSGGGSHVPASTIYGASSGVPTSDNTPTELDPYRNKTKIELFDYLQSEYAGLAGLTHSTSSPLMKAWHNYDNSIPSSFSASACAAADARNVVAVLNVKADNQQLIDGVHDATIASLVQSCPSVRNTYLIVNHEPENDADWSTATAAKWRSAVARFCERVLATRGTLPVVPGVALINWNLHPNNSTFDENLINPAAEMTALGVPLNEVIYTTDGYDTSPTSATGASNLLLSADVARGWGFTRFGLSETACKSYSTASPNDRAVTDDFIRNLADEALAQNLEYVMWFNSGVGNRAGPEGWWIYGDANKAQWAKVCAGVYP
jgi:hypothetical protein